MQNAHLSPSQPRVLLRNVADIDRFAAYVKHLPRPFKGDTGLGAGMKAALMKFDSLGVCTNRKIINVSGDGRETPSFRRKASSHTPDQVRDMAAGSGVDINAHAISNEETDLED